MIPTLFSVSYGGLWGQHALDLLSFIAKAADLGYSAVELMGKRPHLSTLDWSDSELQRVKEYAAVHRIEIATLAGYTDFTAGKGSRRKFSKRRTWSFGSRQNRMWTGLIQRKSALRPVRTRRCP